MEAILYIFVFVFGLILGSFFNVVGLRTAQKQSIAFPASHCPACKNRLRAIDLIPIASFLLLKGKCRNCDKRISPIYPIVEGATAFLFTISPFLVGWSKELLIAWALISLLMIIFVSDIRFMLIPDKVLLAFGVIFIALRVWQPMDYWWEPLLGAIVGFTLLLLIAIISRGGMGGGDIKLFAVLGILLGWQDVLLTFLFATFYGAIIGVIGLSVGFFQRKKPIAFGPYIVLGALTTYFFGQALIQWYVNLL